VSQQTYPKSNLEWIVLDDGNKDRSKDFSDDFTTYVKLYKKINLGRKRQFACNISSGEFIIFFDDDDYHFSNRIEKSVSKLQNVGSRYIAGNSKMLICDVSTNKVYHCGPFHKNHCTAGTMCFRKEIFQGTSFRNSDKSGEEAFFLKNWKIPVLQLDPLESIICLAHNQNTITKDHLFRDDKYEKNLENFDLSNEFFNIFKKILKK
tara:strand:+ start:712 stop:1329 length:618 start_codon:yes stop_codon:yes gene_type:complete